MEAPTRTPERTTPATWLAVPLVCASGLCALVYQIAWTRAFRLIFGASTAASAAVVAIFIAGLGAGGYWLGRRVERSPAPLTYYGHLELAIASLAALTPALLWAAEWVYLALGGSLAMGAVGGTVLRLVLATLVLGGPTFLMGGTLPAVARAVQTEADAQRTSVALLYGLNTFGAVVGCFLANFFMIEVFGTRLTLWLACLLNLLVGVAARSLGRRLGEPHTAPSAESASSEADEVARATDVPAQGMPASLSVAPRPLVLVASGVVGFAFFLLELVWYRMLGPLLGGTVFTFGLILGLALLGIGIGGAVYTLVFARRTARLSGFALTCVLEAFFVALPFALGDRLAVLALLLRPLGALGFLGHIAGWAVVAGITIVPVAIVSGIQFPMLISLLGRGRADVGREIGLAYASNTVGAILGALAGGFGLLPLLGATGSWRATAILLLIMGAVAAGYQLVRDRKPGALVAPLLVAVATVPCVLALGPTAVWRHSGIGAGRAEVDLTSYNSSQAFNRHHRRDVAWEVDGVESSVAIGHLEGISFIVNGKVDGNARADAATQVTAGLLGAFLHPNPTAAMVIGLGTGSTAGWLGAVPSIERVDVVELEPAILEVARRCTPVNEDVLHNPKVHVVMGDAREVLRVSPRKYSLIFSEPSNPYRAGIASLYTQDFYAAMTQKLDDNGLFLQWLQAYEVDPQTVRTVLATLSSVFPQVEVWQARASDLIIVASQRPVAYDVPALRQRLNAEPYARGFRVGWWVEDLEGVLGHYVTNTSIPHSIFESQPEVLNTDDQPLVEFGFARGVGRESKFDIEDLITVAVQRGAAFPKLQNGAVDLARAEYERISIPTLEGGRPMRAPWLAPAYQPRAEVQDAWAQGRVADAVARAGHLDPAATPAPTLLDESVVAELLAHAAAAPASEAIERLRRWNPVQAAAMDGLRLRDADPPAAVAALVSAWVGYRTDPWPNTVVMRRALDATVKLAGRDLGFRARLMEALAEPFAVHVLEDARLGAEVMIDAQGEPSAQCAQILQGMEPNVPWHEGTLRYRFQCYHKLNSELLPNAALELEDYLLNAEQGFRVGDEGR